MTVDINKVTRCDFSEALNISLELIWLFVSWAVDLFFEIMEWKVSRRYQGNAINVNKGRKNRTLGVDITLSIEKLEAVIYMWSNYYK